MNFLLFYSFTRHLFIVSQYFYLNNSYYKDDEQLKTSFIHQLNNQKYFLNHLLFLYRSLYTYTFYM